MKKSTLFLVMSIIFGLLFLVNILFVFDWSNPAWDHNQGAYLTTFSNGLLFLSQLVLYISFKKKERDAA